MPSVLLAQLALSLSADEKMIEEPRVGHLK